MEESIKKAEELIEATNKTLARMQCDSYYEDFSFTMASSKQGDRKKAKKLVFDNMGLVPTPKEKILETDDGVDRNKRHSIGNDKIDGINNKIEAYRLELLKREERESIEALNFDGNESAPATGTTSDTNLSHRTKAKPANLTEDLKSKLQRTQEIVDRGIQTARELNETVDFLRNSGQQKTHRYDEMSLCKSEKLDRSESGSTNKTVKRKRCKRCNAEIMRKTERSKDRKKEDNILVTRIRGRDSASPRRRHNLNFQQLPSLKIQGDLSCQRIPSVDIPPGERDCFPHRGNIAYETYSHDEIIRNRIGNNINNITDKKNWNGYLLSDNAKGTKSMECLNCGKLVRVFDSLVQSEQIDELLKMCDYNVFDPRIDEFVESYGCKIEGKAKYTQTEVETSQPVEIKSKDETLKVERKMRISDLSSELRRKYREKAADLESDHLEFEGIVTELFQKMDESRALFQNCDYLKVVAEEEKRKATLSVTPPVLLSYTGSGEEADYGGNVVLRPTRTQRPKLPTKVIRKKREKKELESNCKLISSWCLVKGNSKTIEIEMTPKPTSPKLKPARNDETSLREREIPKKALVDHKPAIPPSGAVAIKPTSEMSAAESKQISLPEPSQVNLNVITEPAKQTNAVSDYESDFEEESFEEKSPEPEANNNSYTYKTILSTISEVESELDRQASDLAVAHEESNGKVLPKTDEKTRSTKQPNVSSDEDDTRRLLRKVNLELKEVASQKLASTGKSEKVEKLSEGVADPLREVLNALKNQFERTGLLADRLTHRIKEVNEVKITEEGKEISPSNGNRDLVMVNNLQRARKSIENGKVSFPRSHMLRTLRGKSENNVSENKVAYEEIPSLSQSGSVSSKGSVLTRKSYSDGEVSEQETLLSDRSSPSIGEVINENHSDGSLSGEKSVIKF